MFEVGPGELLDLIDKGSEIGFRMRGGSVHPSSVSLGIKHGGARVEKRNIKEFLQEFRGGAESDDDSKEDSKEDSDSEPEDVESKEDEWKDPEEDPVVMVEDLSDGEDKEGGAEASSDDKEDWEEADVALDEEDSGPRVHFEVSELDLKDDAEDVSSSRSDAEDVSSSRSDNITADSMLVPISDEERDD